MIVAQDCKLLLPNNTLHCALEFTMNQIWKPTIPINRITQSVRQLVYNRILAPLRRRRFEKTLIVMVTGTAGKTSTSRLIASILRAAGHTVGLACTDGAYLDGQIFSEKEHSGYAGARRVLNQPDITAAVLETARGSILKRGLYVDCSDVAALTNVGYNHIGIDGVETVAQMALVKSRVTDTAQKAVILNADDLHSSELIDRYPPQKLILVSAHPDDPRVRDIVEKGGRSVILDQDGFIVLEGTRLIHVSDIPLTLDGAALHQAYNAMVATGLAAGLDVGHGAICAGLSSFKGGSSDNPARTSLVDGLSCYVQIETGGHPLSLSATIQTMTNLHPDRRKVVMVSIPGDRDTQHIEMITELLAKTFDDFVCYEVEKYRRDRQVGEIPELLARALVKFGVKPASIIKAQDLDDAFSRLVALLEPGDAAMVLCSASMARLVEKTARQALLPKFATDSLTD